jgi:beta-galactosidase
MVHLLPMDWTEHKPGEPVSVWAYSNADTVELFLNGKSLGARSFDQKTTTYGKNYLETTQATGDDKTVTGGPYPGSYTSPNGSAGRLHLSWTVPYAPGELVAVAKRGGKEVARDVLDTAGAPATVRLSTQNYGSLSFVTADVVDAHGVVVPNAANELTFRVTGGKLLGLDNGQEESAENYQSTSRAAFHGKALAIVRAGSRIAVTSPGLEPSSIRLSDGTPTADNGVAGPVAAVPAADASFSGAPDTIPAAMLDGDLSTGWSNYYRKDATALLPAISKPHASDWVSVAWPSTRQVGSAQLSFTTDATNGLPSSIAVSYWDGQRFVPVRGLHITWATASNEPTRVEFDPVVTTRLKFDMTSGGQFLRIAELGT